MKTSKFFAIILAIVILLSCFPLSFGASAAQNYPIVYVQGGGQQIISADGRTLYQDMRVPIEDGVIADAVKNVVPDFINAVLFGEWDKWHDSFLEFWEPIYKEVRLDDNGEVTNGSHGWWNINSCSMSPNYEIGAYYMAIDWRVDPFETAGILDQFIQKVKQKTGAEKVNLITRCEATNIAMAYLAQYGYEDLNCLELYVSSANGIESIGALFSGKFKLYPEELEKYYYASDLDIGDESVSALIDSALDWLVDSYGFEGTCRLLENSMPKLYKECISDVLLTSYGTFPGIWSLVGPDYYAAARKLVFEGKEEKYAGLIEKIDRYDTEVRQRSDELLLEAKAAGVKIAVISKYTELTSEAPINEECNDVGDRSINVANSSFGSTISDTKYVQLPAEYLAAADPEYISPCKRIDASTCLLPETTWFIYNCEHNDFNQPVNVLLKKFFDMNGEMDVDTFEEFPRYLTYTGSAVRPMTEDDVQMDFEEQAQKDDGFFARFVRAFKAFIELIKKALSMLFNKG